MYELNIKDGDKITKVSMVNSWEDMNIYQFIQLQQILGADIPDTYKSVNIINILSQLDIDYIESLPVNIFSRLNNQTNFILTSIPKVKHKEKYILNNHSYILNADISTITTAQYIDYQSYIKENNPIDLMSLWLIPEGHQYNDGYNMSQVKLDIMDMKLIDVQAVAFFLQMQFASYILIMKEYSKREMKKMKISKKDIRKMETLYNNMASSLLS